MSAGTCCLATSVADTAHLGRKVAILGQLSGGSQAENTCRIAFTRGLGLGIASVDERKGFIRRMGLLAYHPKTGR